MGPLKKLEKNPRFHKAFMQHVLKQLEQFTCLMYAQNRESSVDIFSAKPLHKIEGEERKTHFHVEGRPGSPSFLSLRFKAPRPACEPPRRLVQANPSWKSRNPMIMGMCG